MVLNLNELISMLSHEEPQSLSLLPSLSSMLNANAHLCHISCENLNGSLYQTDQIT